jgi:hypothetical protein
VTSGVNALVSLAHIGMCGKPVWLRRLHLGLLNRSIQAVHQESGHAQPHREARLARYFSLCDYLMLFDLF